MKHERHSTSSRSSLPAVAGFLLPNFLGLICFTFLPIVLSLFMTFTNWSLEPSVNLHFVGLRNYIDIMEVNSIAAEATAQAHLGGLLRGTHSRLWVFRSSGVLSAAEASASDFDLFTKPLAKRQ